MIKAHPMPHYGVPFKPKMPEQRHVEVCPFSFDSRDRERLIQKEKKIEELQKEEVRPKITLPHIQPHKQKGCCWTCFLLLASCICRKGKEYFKLFLLGAKV